VSASNAGAQKQAREDQKQESLGRLVDDLKLDQGARKPQRPIEEDEDLERPADDEEGDFIEGGTGQQRAHFLPDGIRSRTFGGIVEADDGTRWPAV
jgi:hypothetical protein